MQQIPSAHGTELDNPIWHALQGPHRRFAATLGDACWYPAAIAPFIAVPHAGVVPDLAGAAARGWRVPCYFVGMIPRAFPDGWAVAARSRILQMLPTSADHGPDAEDGIQALHIADAPRMVALMQIAFPDFFRARTAELGEYLGIVDGAQLVAMAGERLAFGGWQEISGVCTHPDFVGRGYARRLTRALLHRQRRRGVRSFLHVGEENAAARRLYESMGFAVRASLPIARVGRLEP